MANTPRPPTPSKALAVSAFWLRPGLHKVKRYLQEFLGFFCACCKKHPSALFHATFCVRFCFLNAFLYLFHSYISVYLYLMYHLTLRMTILAIVPGKPIMCLQENRLDFFFSGHSNCFIYGIFSYFCPP